MLYALVMLITAIAAWKPRSEDLIMSLPKNKLQKKIKMDHRQAEKFASKMRNLKDICQWHPVAKAAWQAFEPESKPYDLMQPDPLPKKLSSMSVKKLQNMLKEMQSYMSAQKKKVKKMKKRCNVVCDGFSFDDDSHCTCDKTSCPAQKKAECGCKRAKKCCQIVTEGPVPHDFMSDKRN